MSADAASGNARAGAKPGATTPAQLEARARAWIEPYWNAEHLRRALDWLLELEPQAAPALRLAALTHDMERFVPGGPVFDPGTMQPDEESYRIAHSERSALIVGDWLRGAGAATALVAEVRELVELHEVGGTPAADLVQAADSLSFLEVNAALVVRWLTEGRCDAARARRQHEWMFGRIRPPRARELAQPLYERALAALDEAAAALGDAQGREQGGDQAGGEGAGA